MTSEAVNPILKRGIPCERAVIGNFGGRYVSTTDFSKSCLCYMGYEGNVFDIRVFCINSLKIKRRAFGSHSHSFKQCCRLPDHLFCNNMFPSPFAMLDKDAYLSIHRADQPSFSTLKFRSAEGNCPVFSIAIEQEIAGVSRAWEVKSVDRYTTSSFDEEPAETEMLERMHDFPSIDPAFIEVDIRNPRCSAILFDLFKHDRTGRSSHFSRTSPVHPRLFVVKDLQSGFVPDLVDQTAKRRDLAWTEDVNIDVRVAFDESSLSDRSEKRAEINPVSDSSGCQDVRKHFGSTQHFGGVDPVFTVRICFHHEVGFFTVFTDSLRGESIERMHP